jgi:hypothetical protein
LATVSFGAKERMGSGRWPPLSPDDGHLDRALTGRGGPTALPPRAAYDRAAEGLLRLIDQIGRISVRWGQAAAHDRRVAPGLRGDTGLALGAIESLGAALDNSVRTPLAEQGARHATA